MELIDFIYTNIKVYGGYLFIGSCILVGAYWIQKRISEQI